MATPFSGKPPGEAGGSGGGATHQAAQPVDVAAAPAHQAQTQQPRTDDDPHVPSHTDIYRTFSPSDVAYWDLAKGGGGGGGEGGEGVSATRSGSGFFGKLSALFGGGK